MDDFEKFRQQKEAKKEAARQAEEEQKKLDEAAQKMGWVDGFGFVGPNNPKVKGFILGRARKKRVDPRALEKPKNFERTQLTEDKPAGPQPAQPATEPPPEKPQKYQRF